MLNIFCLQFKTALLRCRRDQPYIEFLKTLFSDLDLVWIAVLSMVSHWSSRFFDLCQILIITFFDTSFFHKFVCLSKHALAFNLTLFDVKIACNFTNSVGLTHICMQKNKILHILFLNFAQIHYSMEVYILTLFQSKISWKVYQIDSQSWPTEIFVLTREILRATNVELAHCFREYR